MKQTKQGAQKLMGDNLIVVLAEFSSCQLLPSDGSMGPKFLFQFLLNEILMPRQSA